MYLLLVKCFSSLFYFKGSWGSLKMDYKQIWLGTSDRTDFSSAERVFIDSDWNVLLKFPVSHLVRVGWFLFVNRCGHHPTFIYEAIFTPSDLSCSNLWIMGIPSYTLISHSYLYGNMVIASISHLQAFPHLFQYLCHHLEQDFTVSGIQWMFYLWIENTDPW